MAIYRSVQMSFWTDPKISDTFSTDEKLLYLYLLTNPHTNLCGCYEVSMKQIAFEAGFTAQQTVKLMSSLMEKRVINYDENTREVLLINWSKYNWTESEKFRKPLKAEIRKVRTEKFRTYLEHLAYGTNTDSDSDGYGTDTVSIPYRYPINTDSDSDGYGTDTTVTVTDTVTDTVSVSNTDTVTGTVLEDSGTTVKDTGKGKPVTKGTGKSGKKDSAKEVFGEYGNVRLTPKEKEKLETEFGVVKTDRAIKYLDEYIEEKHYKSASHYLAIRRWVFNAVEEQAAKRRKSAPSGADLYMQFAMEAAREETYDTG